MKTGIVILNWNGRKFLEKFLPGIVGSVAGTQAEVIIADNASSDGSLDFLKENFPGLKTIPFDRNYGFTGGYNKALRQIEAQYYLLLNSDIEVTDGWLSPLEKWMDEHPECGACAPKLLSYYERNRFEYAGAAGGYIDRLGYPFCRGRVMKMTERDCGQYDSPADVMWASGASLMVRAELFHRLGGFDERFFAHQEEIDLCWRIQLAGYRVTVVPESKIYHVGGGTLPNNSPWKLQLNYRNNLLLLENNLGATVGDRKARRIIRTRVWLNRCSAVVYLLTFRPKYFMAVCRAHRQYRQLKTMPGPMTERSEKADVRGIFPRWIVPMALWYRNSVFNEIATSHSASAPRNDVEEDRNDVEEERY